MQPIIRTSSRIVDLIAKSLRGLILTTCCLSLIVGCASQNNRSVDSGLSAARLDKAELENIATYVNRPPHRVYYLTYEYDPATQSFTVVRGGNFNGFLLVRNLIAFKEFAAGEVTDGRFNRIAFRDAEFSNGEQVLLTIASTPDSTTILALETAESTPELPLVGMLRDNRFFTILAVAEMLRELPCIDQAAQVGSLSHLVNCFGSRASGGSSGDGSRGGASGPQIGTGILLGEPNCSKDMLGPVSYTSPGRDPRNIAGLRRMLDDVRNEGARARDGIARNPTKPEVQELYRDYGRALSNERRAIQQQIEAMENLKNLQDRAAEGDPDVTEDDLRQAEFRVRIANGIRQQRTRERSRIQQQIDQLEEDTGTASGSTTDQPVIGEVAPPRDPRCQGRAVDTARGTLFTNPDFCNGDDPLTCIRRQQDSVYAVTDGQCWSETGPDDAQRIVCGHTTGSLFDRGSRIRAPNPRECEDGDINCWTDPTSPMTSSGKLAIRYLDLTPMGGILIGLCAKGGCPRTP